MGAVTVGTKLGRYECAAALHDADLWLARTDDGTGRHVVLRIVTAEQAQDPKFVRMSDAWGSGELAHPSIAEIDDIGNEQGTHYLATEYIHGEALVQLLARVEERGKQLSLQHVLAIMIAVAEAMHHAHELGIQCAITPSQVLIGYDGTVKLDLGRVGAPARASYRSPEHAAAIATDRRSDVFTLGIVMYESVTLHRLFDAGPGPVAKPSTLRRGLPSEIEKIAMRALATEPADRYVNAGELRAALTQFASKAGMKVGADALAAYLKQMFDKRAEPWLPGGKPSTASRAFDRDFQTEHSTVENVTNIVPTGTEDPTGKISFLQHSEPVKGKLVPVDPTEETKLPEAEISEATVVSPPIVAKAAKAVSKPAPKPLPKPPSKLAPKPLPKPVVAAVPEPPKVAAPRAESRPDTDEQREPTMITSPPPPPLIIASTKVETGDSTAVVKPLPAPGATPRARRPSTAKANADAVPIEEADPAETDSMAAARPSRKRLYIGAAVAVALAIPLVIAMWPSSVARQVAQESAAEPAPVAKRPGPIASGPDPAERAATGSAAEPEPAAIEPPAIEPIEPPIEEPIEVPIEEPIEEPIEPPVKAPARPSGKPKPSVFVPREGTDADKPKPPAPAKVAAKPKPRAAAKSKPIKKPATKKPKGPTYDPDSLFLKKK